MLEVPAGKPAIKEILRNDVKIVGKDYRISDDKIIAKGDINILTLYIGTMRREAFSLWSMKSPYAVY